MTNAQTWIGTKVDVDRLDLAAITKALPPEATHLHSYLASTRVTGLMDMRRAASNAATAAQTKFKRLSAAAVLGTAIATLSSGLLLYGAGSDATAPPTVSRLATPAPAPGPPSAPAGTGETPAVAPALVERVNQHRKFIVVAQIIGLFMSAVAAGMLASQNLVDRWAQKRREAEAQRREVFNEVLRLAKEAVSESLPAPDPANPVRQALEFFRRYQLELQDTYYGKGGTRHERATTQLSWATAILAGIAAVTSALAGWGDWGLVLSAFLGIAVPILLSAAQSWRAVSRDTDKAAAYAKALAELKNIQLDLDKVRKEADLGDVAAVQAYIDRVHLAMTTENDAWVPAART